MFIRINEALNASIGRRKDNEKGFTLIELLVVVIIIGILAAIAIPVFIGQQNGAKEAAAKSDIANIKTAVVAYYAKNDAMPADAAALADYGYVASSGVTAAGWEGDVNLGTLCVEATSENGTTFSASATGATVTGGC